MREDETQAELFRGIVQTDDYYFGGTPRREERNKVGRGRGSKKKRPIVGLVESATGKVRTAVIPDVSQKSVLTTVGDWIDKPNTVLHSDEWTGYDKVGSLCQHHGVCNHKESYVSKEGVYCNGVENAWSLFARAIMGAFHHVSVKHLPRYLSTFDSRFNARTDGTTIHFDRILTNSVNRSLPISKLVAKP